MMSEGVKMKGPAGSVALLPLPDMPLVAVGDDVASLILSACKAAGIGVVDGDILVVAQKIISKAEGRTLDLNGVEPSPRAIELAQATHKDPRFVEAVLVQSSEVVRAVPNILITRHHLGHVMANAGIDRSNISAEAEAQDKVLLLPEDPAKSAARLRARIEGQTGRRIGVIISDSFGRPWRIGTTGVALGVAGPPWVIDQRGDSDLFGKVLQVTQIAFADSVAAAAVLLMGEGAEGVPAVILRGLAWADSDQNSNSGIRKVDEDLFR